MGIWARAYESRCCETDPRRCRQSHAEADLGMSRAPAPPACRDRVLILLVLSGVAPANAPLPGLFTHNPVPDVVNLPLWTLKYEALCYFGLALLRRFSSFLTFRV